MEQITKKQTFWADISLFIVAIIWGSGFIATKNALDVIPPLYLTGVRFSIGCMVLSCIFYKRLGRLKKSDLQGGLIVGLILFLAFTAQTIGLQSTDAGKSAFLTGTNVVVVPFLYWLIHRHAPDKYAFAAAFICVFGIGLLSLNTTSLAIHSGDLLTLLCAFFFACHIASTGYYAKRMDPLVLSIIQFAVVAILSTGSGFFFETLPTNLPISSWYPVVYLALFSTCIAFVLQTVGQKYTYSTHAAIILSMESVFGTLFGVLLLNEVLTLKMTMGCLSILIAILTAETKWSFLSSKNKRTSEFDVA